MYIYFYIHMRTYLYLYKYLYIHISEYIHIFTHIYISFCIYIYTAPARVFLCIYIIYIFIYMYIYIQIYMLFLCSRFPNLYLDFSICAMPGMGSQSQIPGMRFESRLCDVSSQCVAVCCSVLQCVAVCCSVLQCVAVCLLQGHKSFLRLSIYLYHVCNVCDVNARAVNRDCEKRHVCMYGKTHLNYINEKDL